MKTHCFALVLLIVTFAFTASAQRNVTPVIERDPVMEADAKHNLEVSWYTFKIKKAYKGVLDRFEETYAAYPDFSKIDEFLYIAGMSSYYLADNKGKQKVNLAIEKERERFAPEKLRADATAYLSAIVDKYPDSKFAEDAKKTLATLKAVK